MLWAIVGGVILLLLVVSAVRSRKEREAAERRWAAVGPLGSPGTEPAAPAPASAAGSPTPSDLSHVAGGARLLDATGAPLTESHTIQVHQAKYFPPATTLLSDEGVRRFAEPLMDAAERAARDAGAPTDFERYCIMVREDLSMNLMLKWSEPIPARAVHAVAAAMDAQARSMGGRPGSA